MESRWLTRMLIVLAIAKCALLVAGFDRLPLASNADEVLMADQAATLAQGQGLRAASFEGLAIGIMYAHHPPVYSYLLAIVFRIGGVNVYTLRALPILAYMAFHAVYYRILWRLRERKWLTAGGFNLAFMLLVSEPMGFVDARFGRMSAMVPLFAALAFLCLLSRGPSGSGEQAGILSWKHALGSAVFMGITLSTYIGGAFAAVAWAITVAMLGWRRPWQVVVTVATPMILFAAVWGLTYGSRSWEGIRQMRDIAKSMVQPGLGFSWLAANVAAGHGFREFFQIGGFTLISALVLSCAILLASVPIAFRRFIRREDVPCWPRHIWALFVPVCCWAVMLSLTGAGRGKLTAFVALVFVALALAWSTYEGRALRRIYILGMAGSLLGVAQIAGYSALGFMNWDRRSPDRFAALVANIPPEATVAAVPPLWLTFHERGQKLRVVDMGFGPDRTYWETYPQRIAEFQYVILSAGHPLLDEPALVGRPLQKFDMMDFKIVVVGPRL